MVVNTYLEWSATLLSLLFLFALIRRKAWAWGPGIISSILSVWLFARIGLYAETMLYAIYVVMGIFGWVNWQRNVEGEDEVPLRDLPWRKQWPSLFGIPVALLLAYSLSHFPGVSWAYFDSFTSVFAIIATYQETKRIRTAFHYWIPINLATMVLYGLKGVWIYATLMLVYTIMSVVGMYKWRQ
jgi:nicotinamide mononucleotide transporter